MITEDIEIMTRNAARMGFRVSMLEYVRADQRDAQIMLGCVKFTVAVNNALQSTARANCNHNFGCVEIDNLCLNGCGLTYAQFISGCHVCGGLIPEECNGECDRETHDYRLDDYLNDYR